MPKIQRPPKQPTSTDPGGAPLFNIEAPVRRQADRRRISGKSSAKDTGVLLPVSTTAFVGRESDLEAISGLLERSRLVTLVGGGGLGKTRLSLEAGFQCAARFTDGVRSVELASISDPDLVPHAVASSLRIGEESQADPLELLISFLRDCHLLMILDNCEHLIDSAAMLAEKLLTSSAHLSILVTSRQPLGVTGESVWKVLPLAVPPPDEDDPGALEEYESVRLFVLRAAATTPGFALNEDNASAIAEICRRLDGIPLAIELAAARADTFSPDQIVARMDERFRFLRSRDPATTERHRSLEAAVRWSMDLLSDAERDLLPRLAVFAGAFSAGSAREVCGSKDLPGAGIPALLEELASKSLLLTDLTGAGARYRMLQTIRDAVRSLGGRQDWLQEAHARWYLKLAETAEEHFGGQDEQQWLERLATEHDNLRGALDWALDAKPSLALRLAAGLGSFWRLHGHWIEGQQWLMRSLDRAKRAKPEVRAKAIYALGMLSVLMGDFKRSAEAAGQSLEILRKGQDTEGIARALNLLGLLSVFQHPPRAVPLLEESVTLARAAGDTWCLSDSLALLGQVKIMTGRPHEATLLLEESLSIARKSGNRRGMVTALVGLGLAKAGQGIMPTRDLVQEALAEARSTGGRYELADSLISLGDVMRVQQTFDSAQELLEESLVLAEQVGSPLLRARSLRGLGFLAEAQGNLGAAEHFFDQAIPIAREANLDFLLVRCLLGRGSVTARRGAPQQAGRFWLEALEVARRNEDKQGEATALFTLGRQSSMSGDDDKAAGLNYEALLIFFEMGDRSGVSRSLAALGHLAAGQGRYSYAARVLGAAHALTEAVLPGSGRPLDASHGGHPALALLRKNMDGQQLRKAWEQGARMSAEEAVDYVSRGRGARGGRGTSGWDSLTRVERQVAELIDSGLDDREIAERLFISPRTVGHHLSHIFTKLGISSRRDLRTLIPVSRHREE